MLWRWKPLLVIGLACIAVLQWNHERTRNQSLLSKTEASSDKITTSFSPPIEHHQTDTDKQNHSDDDDDIVNVAICVLITSSSTHGATDLKGTLDGAAVLRRSILNLYNNITSFQAPRTVGLATYNRNNTSWMKPTTQVVSIHEFKLPSSNRTVHLRFVAMINDDVKEPWQHVVHTHGFEAWKARAPLEHTEVRHAENSQKIVKDGAIGISELIKLDGLRMTDFDKVLFVDCDVMFHHRFDELLEVRENLAWTHGGWESEKINGGFLVYSPKHPLSLIHMEHIMELLREGSFLPGSGWKGSGIGWTYGGLTVQGIVPYYYFLESNQTQHDFAAKASDVAIPYAHREIDRCRYNNMVQLDECKNRTYESVASNHFTGECSKPWWCAPKIHPLCDRFRVQFANTYRQVVQDLAQQKPNLVSDAVLEFVQNLGSNEWCLGGNTFESVSASIYANAG